MAGKVNCTPLLIRQPMRLTLVGPGLKSSMLSVGGGTSVRVRASVMTMAVSPFVLADVVKIATAYSLYRLCGDRVEEFVGR